jgi:two-component system phosphate regulon sensor histidine kinase PhoR
VRGRRLLWQLYRYHLLILILSLLAVGWHATRALREFDLEQTTSNLESKARLIARQLAEQHLLKDPEAVDAFCKELAKTSATRITVVAPSGEVMGDSDESPRLMENHGNRPEILDAFSGKTGRATRRSATLRREMMYVAVPVLEGSKAVAAVRTSLALTSVSGALRPVYERIALVGMAVVALAAVADWLLSRRISRTLTLMKRGAERFAAGDFTHKLPMPDSGEMASLATALNRMATDLGDRIATVTRQRTEIEAVLSSMAEGVVAVDTDERVILLNSAAAQLFGISADGAPARSLQEVIRNAEFQDFVSEVLSRSGPMEKELLLYRDGQFSLQAHGAVLRNSEGCKLGALVVLNDVTRLRRLETVRRDFVANVSHELKTPITSIRGFVETLQEGAVNNATEARRFLAIIREQAEHLNSIVEDLHALRHTFGTHLSKNGVQPRTAQAAMRHSSLDLNMNIYTDPSLLEVAGAIEPLPALSLEGAAERNLAMRAQH